MRKPLRFRNVTVASWGALVWAAALIAFVPRPTTASACSTTCWMETRTDWVCVALMAERDAIKNKWLAKTGLFSDNPADYEAKAQEWNDQAKALYVQANALVGDPLSPASKQAQDLMSQANDLEQQALVQCASGKD